MTRPGPGDWRPVGRPEYLRQQAELSLRHLGLDRLPLLQLHRIDPQVPLADQIGELKKLQDEGKVGHIGLSEVSVEELQAAQQIADIVTVQNLFNLTNRSAEPLLAYSAEHGIGFIPWFPLATGKLAGDGSPLQQIAQRRQVSASQLSHWRGCCIARRSCCRSPARPRSRTWRTTWRRRRSPCRRKRSTS